MSWCVENSTGQWSKPNSRRCVRLTKRSSIVWIGRWRRPKRTRARRRCVTCSWSAPITSRALETRCFFHSNHSLFSEVIIVIVNTGGRALRTAPGVRLDKTVRRSFRDPLRARAHRLLLLRLGAHLDVNRAGTEVSQPLHINSHCCVLGSGSDVPADLAQAARGGWRLGVP